MDDCAHSSDRHAFDFLFGKWRIHHRRLRERLVVCAEWDEFGAEYECWPILGGLGNFDQMTADPDGGGIVGCSLRYFSPEDGLWRIYWIDSKRLTLDTPVVGRMEDGNGVFDATELIDGREVLVRFAWLDCDEREAHWQQSFSADGGGTWETNWTMDFSR